MKWQYLAAVIIYDEKARGWVVEGRNQPAGEGIQSVLNAYGAEGWELVGLVADRQEVVAHFAQWGIETQAYRAVFKRPQE